MASATVEPTAEGTDLAARAVDLVKVARYPPGVTAVGPAEVPTMLGGGTSPAQPTPTPARSAAGILGSSNSIRKLGTGCSPPGQPCGGAGPPVTVCRPGARGAGGDARW